MQEVPRIKCISSHKPGWGLVTFMDGEVREIEWARFARPGTVLADLADPEFSSQATVTDNGYTVEWPNGADWSWEVVYDRSTPVAQPSRLSA